MLQRSEASGGVLGRLRPLLFAPAPRSNQEDEWSSNHAPQAEPSRSRCALRVFGRRRGQRRAAGQPAHAVGDGHVREGSALGERARLRVHPREAYPWRDSRGAERRLRRRDDDFVRDRRLHTVLDRIEPRPRPREGADDGAGDPRGGQHGGRCALRDDLDGGERRHHPHRQPPRTVRLGRDELHRPARRGALRDPRHRLRLGADLPRRARRRVPRPQDQLERPEPPRGRRQDHRADRDVPLGRHGALHPRPRERRHRRVRLARRRARVGSLLRVEAQPLRQPRGQPWPRRHQGPEAVVGRGVGDRARGHRPVPRRRLLGHDGRSAGNGRHLLLPRRQRRGGSEPRLVLGDVGRPSLLRSHGTRPPARRRSTEWPSASAPCTTQ